MNWLGRIFKKKKSSYPNDQVHRLLIIDEKAELVHHNLGITEERADELLKMCLAAYREHKLLYTALEFIVSNCKHTNEVVFSTMIFQKIIERENSKEQMLNHLKSILGHG